MDYMTLFSAANRDKPRFAALARAVLKQTDDLIALVPQLESGFSVAGGAGIQLDALGDSCGIPRPEGMNDEDYRQVLRVKLALFRWDGINDTVAPLLAEVLPGASYSDNSDGSVTLTPAEMLPLPAKKLFPVPAGMKVINGE